MLSRFASQPRSTGAAAAGAHALGRPTARPATHVGLGVFARGAEGHGRAVRAQADATQVQDTGIGPPKLGPQFEPTRFGSPTFQTLYPVTMESAKADSKPIMLYLPGIDGTGLAAYRQFPRLQEAFSLITLTVPTEDRTSFEGLVELIVDFLKHKLVPDISTERPVYILGESFGGVLAVAVAAQVKNEIDRIVLINPATSYEDTPWSSLRPLLRAIPEELYPSLPFLLAPVLGNPLAMAGHQALLESSVFGKIGAYRDGLVSLLPTLGKLAEILPQATLDYKLQLLQDGNVNIKDKFGKVSQRTLVLVGDQDLMLPSSEEGKRLPQIMRNCRTRELKGRSHALLQEAGVDLREIMEEEGFLVTSRRMSGTAAVGTRNANNFGGAGPVELPTMREVDIGGERSGWLRAAVSPVFYTTDAAGRVHQGLDELNITPGKPVLLIGNHQTVPTDLAFVIEEVLREKSTLVRGLTHPGAFLDPSTFAAASDATSSGTGAEGATTPKRNNFGDFLEAWGAVPVGPKNLHDLLRNGECVLLYPGGAQEALKGTSIPEKYKLYWPPSSRPEFVRFAAKFGATIIPFGAVGAEDQVKTVMSADSLEWLFPSKSKRAPVQARKGVSRMEGITDSLASPLYVPVGIERYYYLFGRPIETSADLKGDKEGTKEVYEQVKAGVDDCISYLLENRERDPYRNLLRRVAYEQTGKKPAPGFEVDAR